MLVILRGMGTRTWYVTAANAKVNFSTAVVNGLATAKLYKVVEGDETVSGPGRFRRSLWRAEGAQVTPAAVAAATAAQSADAVPNLDVSRAAGYSRPARAKDLTAVSATTGSGAVSLDVRKGAVHAHTLTGNVTSLTLTGLAESPGKAFEIHFVQDGTGSRTLAGVNASTVKLAGGALALSSGAGKRDVLRFRVVGGAAVETGRALNV